MIPTSDNCQCLISLLTNLSWCVCPLLCLPGGVKHHRCSKHSFTILTNLNIQRILETWRAVNQKVKVKDRLQTTGKLISSASTGQILSTRISNDLWRGLLEKLWCLLGGAGGAHRRQQHSWKPPNLRFILRHLRRRGNTGSEPAAVMSNPPKKPPALRFLAAERSGQTFLSFANRAF